MSIKLTNGCIVQFRDDLVINDSYGHLMLLEPMDENIDSLPDRWASVTQVSANLGTFQIRGYGYHYSTEMLQNIIPPLCSIERLEALEEGNRIYIDPLLILEPRCPICKLAFPEEFADQISEANYGPFELNASFTDQDPQNPVGEKHLWCDFYVPLSDGDTSKWTACNHIVRLPIQSCNIRLKTSQRIIEIA